jgi:hypothetical protein
MEAGAKKSTETYTCGVVTLEKQKLVVEHPPRPRHRHSPPVGT